MSNNEIIYFGRTYGNKKSFWQHWNLSLQKLEKGFEWFLPISSRCWRTQIIRNLKNGERSWSINCRTGHQGKMRAGPLIRSQTRLKQQQQLLLLHHLWVGKISLCRRKMTDWFIFNIRKTILKGETQYFLFWWELRARISSDSVSTSD